MEEGGATTYQLAHLDGVGVDKDKSLHSKYRAAHVDDLKVELQARQGAIEAGGLTLKVLSSDPDPFEISAMGPRMNMQNTRSSLQQMLLAGLHCISTFHALRAMGHVELPTSQGRPVKEVRLVHLRRPIPDK